MQWNGTTCFEFDRKPMDTEITAWSTFHNGRKAIVEKKNSVRRKKSKRAGLYES